MRRSLALSKLKAGKYYILYDDIGSPHDHVVQFAWSDLSAAGDTIAHVIQEGKPYRYNMSLGYRKFYVLPALEDLLYNGGNRVCKYSKVKGKPRVSRIK